MPLSKSASELLTALNLCRGATPDSVSLTLVEERRIFLIKLTSDSSLRAILKIPCISFLVDSKILFIAAKEYKT